MTEAFIIDAAERVLMAETLRRLADELDGAELEQAIDAFGFADLLSEAPRDAVSALFTALGRAAWNDVRGRKDAVRCVDDEPAPGRLHRYRH